MKSMNEAAKEVIDELLALPQEELQRRFDEHKPGELAQMLEYGGFGKTQAEDMAMRSLLRKFANNATDLSEHIKMINIKTEDDVLISSKLETMQLLIKEYDEFISDKNSKHIHGTW